MASGPAIKHSTARAALLRANGYDPLKKVLDPA